MSNTVVVGVERRREGRHQLWPTCRPGRSSRDAVVPAHLHAVPLEFHAELEVLAAAWTLLSCASVLRCASHLGQIRGLATRPSA
jgi:hypothetical protein